MVCETEMDRSIDRDSAKARSRRWRWDFRGNGAKAAQCVVGRAPNRPPNRTANLPMVAPVSRHHKRGLGLYLTRHKEIVRSGAMAILRMMAD